VTINSTILAALLTLSCLSNKHQESYQSFQLLVESAVNLIIEIEIPVYKVRATYYNAVPAQTNEHPHITACNYRIDLGNPIKHRYVALSRDLIRPTEWHSEEQGYRHDAPFAFGDTILVSGSDEFDGHWIVADSMNKRYNGQFRIDFLVTKSYIAFDSGMEIEIRKKNI
jgi:hypothetical protein